MGRWWITRTGRQTQPSNGWQSKGKKNDSEKYDEYNVNELESDIKISDEEGNKRLIENDNKCDT